MFLMDLLKGVNFGTSLVVQWLGPLTGDMGLIPGQGTKIPHAEGQLKPVHLNYRAYMLVTRQKPMCHN